MKSLPLLSVFALCCQSVASSQPRSPSPNFAFFAKVWSPSRLEQVRMGASTQKIMFQKRTSVSKGDFTVDMSPLEEDAEGVLFVYRVSKGTNDHPVLLSAGQVHAPFGQVTDLLVEAPSTHNLINISIRLAGENPRAANPIRDKMRRKAKFIRI